MANPLVSVIIPVYNVAKFLERCVDSVLAQTYTNLEIILIDDGSTDMSGKFCDVYAKKDPRVKVIHQPNAGLSAARNSGLKIAHGDYVTFVDSDDYIELNLIDYLLSLCLDHNVPLSVCNFREFSVAEPPKTLTDNFSVEVLKTPVALQRLLCDSGFSVSAWAKMYARDLFHGVTFPVGRIYEDVGTTYKLFLECDRIAISSAKLYDYFYNPNSISRGTFSLKKLDLIDLTDRMSDDLEVWGKQQSPEIATDIEFLTKKRRMHARFAILRQIIFVELKSLPPDEKNSILAARRSIIKYLRHHKGYLIGNPFATKRDRLALASLLLGLPVFKLAWKSYSAQKS